MRRVARVVLLLRFAFVKVALVVAFEVQVYLLSWITLQHRSLEQTGSNPWTAMSTHSSLSPPAQSPSTLHSCALSATVSEPVFLHLRSYMQTVSAAQARVAMHASFETAVAAQPAAPVARFLASVRRARPVLAQRARRLRPVRGVYARISKRSHRRRLVFLWAAVAILCSPARPWRGSTRARQPCRSPVDARVWGRRGLCCAWSCPGALGHRPRLKSAGSADYCYPSPDILGWWESPACHWTGFSRSARVNGNGTPATPLLHQTRRQREKSACAPLARDDPRASCHVDAPLRVVLEAHQQRRMMTVLIINVGFAPPQFDDLSRGSPGPVSPTSL